MKRFVRVACVVCVLAGVIWAAPKRGGNRGGAGAPKSNVEPTWQPTAPSPWVAKLLGAYPWQQALSIKSLQERRSAVMKIAGQFSRDHSEPMQATVIGVYKELSTAEDLSAVFECNGELPDGTRFQVIVEVPVVEHADNEDARQAANERARAKAETLYQKGKLYEITGTTEEHPIGNEINAGDRPGLGFRLEFQYGAAKVREHMGKN